MVDAARTVLNNHNLGLEFLSFDKSPINFHEEFSLTEHALECRKLAHQVYDDQINDPKKIKRLPVIYVNAHRTVPYCGKSFVDKKTYNWLPFVLIYSNTKTSCTGDEITFLHEIGHCAENKHTVLSKSSVIDGIMMTREEGFDQKQTPFNRINMNITQVKNIVSAYFSL